MQVAKDEMNIVYGIMQAHIQKNASVAQSQEEYAKIDVPAWAHFDAAFESYRKAEAEKAKQLQKSKEIDAVLKNLKEQPLVVREWQEQLWITILDKVSVSYNREMIFRFKDGSEVRGHRGI